MDLGFYYLKEVKAPPDATIDDTDYSYVQRTDKIEFTLVDAQPDGKLDEVDGRTNAVGDTGADAATYALTVTNKRSFNLAETGAAGIALMVLAGVLLIGGGTFLTVRQRH